MDQKINAQCKPNIISANPSICQGGKNTLIVTNTDWLQRADFPLGFRRGSVAFGIGNKGYVGIGGNLDDFWEYNPITNVWTQKANYSGGGSQYGVGFNIGSKGYICTGNKFYEYNPSTNAWTKKADFGGVARLYAVGFGIGAKGYIGTGYNGIAKNDFWEYDPNTNIWTQKANFGGQPRYEATGFSIGSKGYIGTGWVDLVGVQKDFWEYDPAVNSWTQKANIAGVARNNATGFSIGTKGYIGTGSDGGATANIYLKDFWEYETLTDKWTQKPDLLNDRSEAIGFSIGSRGFICFGTNISNSYGNLWEYDPIQSVAWSNGIINDTNIINAPGIYNATITRSAGCVDSSKIEITSLLPLVSVTANKSSICYGEIDTIKVSPLGDQWVKKADFAGALRTSASSFSIGSKGYVGIGYKGLTYYNDFWEYDPKTDVWTQKANFGGTGRREGIGFSIGTKGYMGMGATGINVTLVNYKDIWEYNPISNTWTKMADFAGAARAAAVGFSIGSKGYIGTGSTGTSTYHKDFWEFDPISNIWVQKADFGGTARSSAVGFCIGDKGYIGTGGIQGVNYVYKKDFWEYNPSNNTWTQKTDFKGGTQSGASGFSIGNKGYIGCGWSSNYTEWFYEFDPKSNAWTYISKFSGAPRSSAICFSIGSKAYLGTGTVSGNWAGDFYEYSPSQTYNWSTSTKDTLDKITINNPSIYTITITNSQGCPKMETITINGNTLAPSKSDTQTFNFSATVANLVATGTNIKWYDSTGSTLPLNSSTILIHNKTYYVSQTIGSCESGRYKVLVKLINVNSISQDIEKGIHLFPNPSSSIVNIQSDNKIESIELKDITGKIVLPISNTNQFDLSPLKKGTYFLSIKTVSGIYNKIVIKD